MLGLAITEVLGGLARAMDNRPRIRIGWLTPLLSLVVLLDITTYWALGVMFRQSVEPTFLTFIGAMTFASIYYLAAYRVFPSKFTGDLDLDSRFFEVRRFVLGIVIATRLLDLVVVASIPEHAQALRNAFTIGSYVIVLALVAVAMLATNRRIVLPALVALISFYIIGPAAALLMS